MTPKQFLRKAILDDAGYNVTEADVDTIFVEAEADGAIIDFVEDFRGGAVETDVPPPLDRNYEAKSVAAKVGDQWVGWTYWYGGGKYGRPEEIPWMDGAYFLTCVEEQKVVTVRTFTKVKA